MNPRKRKPPKRDGAGSSGPGWEIVYSGFVLILLCFFIMMSSFASIEQGKMMQFVKSFVNAVGIFSGGVNLEPGKRLLPKSSKMVNKESDLADVYGQLRSIARRSGMSKKLQLLKVPKGVVMRLPETVLFNRGDGRILAEGAPFLNRLGDFISKTDHAIRIEGHTDSDPISTARYPSNWELSTARAVGVLRYFVENGYTAPEEISAAGFSEFKPIAPNDGAENKAKNRRVEIMLIKKSVNAARTVQ